MNVEPRTVTVAEFEAAAQRVVEANPDRTNPVFVKDFVDGILVEDAGCAYLLDGQSCLIGHVLIHEFDATYNASWEGTTALGLLSRLGFSQATMYAANYLQKQADQIRDGDEERVDGPRERVTWAEAWTTYQATKSHVNLRMDEL